MGLRSDRSAHWMIKEERRERFEVEKLDIVINAQIVDRPQICGPLGIRVTRVECKHGGSVFNGFIYQI